MHQIHYQLTESEVNKIAKLISDNLQIQDVILLNGGLGSGKTYLVKQICNNLQIIQNVSSPTFGIYHQYYTDKFTVWHYDLYRLKQKIDWEEMCNLDFEEAIQSGVTMIEWAERMNFSTEKNTLSIDISYSEKDASSRNYKITFSKDSKWSEIFLSRCFVKDGFIGKLF